MYPFSVNPYEKSDIILTNVPDTLTTPFLSIFRFLAFLSVPIASIKCKFVRYTISYNVLLYAYAIHSHQTPQSNHLFIKLNSNWAIPTYDRGSGSGSFLDLNSARIPAIYHLCTAMKLISPPVIYKKDYLVE